MNVLFLTQTGRVGASARYRVYQFLPYLEAHGVRCTVAPAVSDALATRYMRGGRVAKLAYYCSILGRRLADLPSIASYDVVFLQRDFLVHTYPAIELMMSVIHRRLVLDLDDATFLFPSAAHPSYLLRLLNDPRKIERIAMGCAHFIAGNAVLAAYARPFARAVTVIPTSIDLDTVVLHRSVNEHVAPVIGWIGSPGTLPYLRRIFPALERLHAKGVRFTLRVIGADVVDNVAFPVESRPWQLATEAEEVAGFDIGVMPLSDDAWSWGKSATKLLQYQAAGVAAVASPIGANVDILQNGIYGLAATTLEDWEVQIAKLLLQSDLRRRLGEAGREMVAREYSVAASAPKLLSVLRAVAQTG